MKRTKGQNELPELPPIPKDETEAYCQRLTALLDSLVGHAERISEARARLADSMDDADITALLAEGKDLPPGAGSAYVKILALESAEGAATRKISSMVPAGIQLLKQMLRACRTAESRAEAMVAKYLGEAVSEQFFERYGEPAVEAARLRAPVTGALQRMQSKLAVGDVSYRHGEGMELVANEQPRELIGKLRHCLAAFDSWRAFNPADSTTWLPDPVYAPESQAGYQSYAERFIAWMKENEENSTRRFLGFLHEMQKNPQDGRTQRWLIAGK